jgi:hypothetical protein
VQYDSIHSFFGPGGASEPLRERCEEIETADLIYGRDVNSRNTFLLYGRDLLEEIASLPDGESRTAERLGIELDQETDELEMVAALITLVKGRCDYQTGSDQ